MSFDGSGMKPKLHLPLRTIATYNSLTLSPTNSLKNGCLNSPVANLTLNLSELSTGRGTPRRKLSLSSLDTPTGSQSSCHPTPERMSSVESGVFVDSPTPLDSPTLEMSMHRFASTVKPEIPLEAFSTRQRTIAFRKVHSMPAPMMRLSPVDFDENKENEIISEIDSFSHENSNSSGVNFYSDESSSQDSGLGFEKDKEDDFQFTAPVGIPPKTWRSISEDTCSPHKYSPVKYHSPSKPRSNSAPNSLDFSGEIVPLKQDSPLKCCRLVSFDDDDTDDGFLDIMDQEVAQINDKMPGSMASLFKAPVLSKELPITDDDTPVSRRTCRRLLHRSQSFDVRSRPFSYKRDPPNGDGNTPVQNKRRRPGFPDSPESDNEEFQPKYRVQRCHSETEAVIKRAVNKIVDEPDLIGDCSKPYCLPTVSGKHGDLKYITPDTMQQVLRNEYADNLEGCYIIDCRYPYEYNGGHIKGAENIYTKEAIIEKFMKNPVKCNDPNKRIALVFHCEFSSERAPNLSRFLRKQDRDTNKDCYPGLHYPEIYLLEGGYKAFYEYTQEFSEPCAYKPMLHKDHGEDLRHFRAKSKSWAGERSNRPSFRPLKFY
ncbi:hypothetical protein ScPMuIL_006377 [Solemya velum]